MPDVAELSSRDDGAAGVQLVHGHRWFLRARCKVVDLSDPQNQLDLGQGSVAIGVIIR
jgi:hypothetical protein